VSYTSGPSSAQYGGQYGGETVTYTQGGYSTGQGYSTGGYVTGGSGVRGTATYVTGGSGVHTQQYQ
jgi:hypothetical protein